MVLEISVKGNRDSATAEPETPARRAAMSLGAETVAIRDRCRVFATGRPLAAEGGAKSL